MKNIILKQKILKLGQAVKSNNFDEAEHYVHILNFHTIIPSKFSLKSAQISRKPEIINGDLQLTNKIEESDREQLLDDCQHDLKMIDN